MPQAQKRPSEDSPLVAHARRELRLIGEDDFVITGLCKVIRAFADMGHSGGSAPHAIAYLERLLRFQPLSELTDDPGEWIDRHADGTTPVPLWQSDRNPEAFSTDGGKTYTLLSEKGTSNDATTYPIHTSKHADLPHPAEESA